MSVIEAQCASILVSHDHRHISQKRTLRAADQFLADQSWISGCKTPSYSATVAVRSWKGRERGPDLQRLFSLAIPAIALGTVAVVVAHPNRSIRPGPCPAERNIGCNLECRCRPGREGTASLSSRADSQCWRCGQAVLVPDCSWHKRAIPLPAGYGPSGLAAGKA